LTELDGFRERNLLVIGATNRYEVLDEALIRPGRLSLKIQLGLLHLVEDRRRLIELAIAKVEAKVDPDIVDKLVETTNSWSPANIVAMVNGGIRIAQREKQAPEMCHFVQSRTTVLLGEDPQSVEVSDSSAWHIAVHEAGHAVAAVLHGIPFVQATVSGSGNIKGFVERIADDEIYTSKKLGQYIDMSLAGRAAERLLAEPTDGVGSDFARATQLAARMVRLGLGGGNIITLEDETTKEFVHNNRDAVERLLRDRMDATENMLMKKKDALKAVAKALMIQKVLFEADIRAIVDAEECSNV
jgi:cell division protease FtsH